jgi:hypothetical protein
MNREDLYEAAVRSVLDLCDEADDAGVLVDPSDIRMRIRDALLREEEES